MVEQELITMMMMMMMIRHTSDDVLNFSCWPHPKLRRYQVDFRHLSVLCRGFVHIVFQCVQSPKNVVDFDSMLSLFLP